MSRRVAYFVLWGLLLVLALRMTMTETVRETISQISGQLAARADPKGVQGSGPVLPEIGPAVTTLLAAITFVLAGAAAWCAASTATMSLGRLGRLGLILVVLGVGLASTFAAADKFLAVVGLSDVGMALLAGWSIGVLCQEKMLGDSGRRIVIAALVAILAAWVAKGLYQRTVEIPDTIQYYKEHQEEALTAAFGTTRNMKAGDPQLVLFESRMNSNEVTGFVTLSNVMGAGMIGLLAVLGGLVAARRVDSVVDEVEGDKEKSSEISLPTLLTSVAIGLGVLGVVVLFLTASRGASVIGVAAVATIAAGAFFWQKIVLQRRVILAVTGVAVVLAATGVVGYGLTHDRLPSKSLLFRWHYWTASAALIEHSPWLGVGLNNFGDYYTSVKRSSSPEDVKDPHSFFVRLAAEMGISAAVLIGMLILWMALGATRLVSEGEKKPREYSGKSFIFSGAIFCAAWWIIHQLIGEAADQYYFLLSMSFAIIAAAGWALASGLLGLIQARGVRFVAVTALIGGIGMLAYDQINMALVTGPVAMLFWMLLGLADSYDSPAEKRDASSFKAASIGVGGLCGVSGAALLCGVCLPMMTGKGGGAWDASPYVIHYLEASHSNDGAMTNLLEAKEALTEALKRSPRSMELHRQMMGLKMRLHEPVAGDIRTMLSLDRANARIRMDLAMPDTDMPAAERIAILQQALQFDAQLPSDEIMRLSAEDHTAIQRKMEALESTASQPRER